MYVKSQCLFYLAFLQHLYDQVVDYFLFSYENSVADPRHCDANPDSEILLSAAQLEVFLWSGSKFGQNFEFCVSSAELRQKTFLTVNP